MANDKQDTSLPHELSLDRVNHLPDIDRAIETVNEYLPIPKFEPSRNGPPFSTTVISAFFPPPPDEPLQRGMKNGRGRGVDEYLHGLKVMAETSQYLVVFVPPGDIAESLRSMNRTNVVVLDHYTTLWEIPHLQGKREEFYGRQVELLAGAYPPQEAPYGEPHSWGAWNAKSFLILEALRLDPFQSSHFVWLDARVPGFRWARGVGTNTSPIGWPTPHAIRNAYDAIYNADRAIVFALDRPLRTPDTPYWPRFSISGKNTGGHMTDIHAVYGGMVLGNKSAMARLARALLILVERDLARGYYVGREEFQLSYVHFEFANLLAVVEHSEPRPERHPIWKIGYPYRLFGSTDTNFTAVGLEREPRLEGNTAEAPAADPMGMLLFIVMILSLLSLWRRRCC